jgi:hypothetical protein
MAVLSVLPAGPVIQPRDVGHDIRVPAARFGLAARLRRPADQRSTGCTADHMDPENEQVIPKARRNGQILGESLRGHRHRAWWLSIQEHRNDTHRSWGGG